MQLPSAWGWDRGTGLSLNTSLQLDDPLTLSCLPPSYQLALVSIPNSSKIVFFCLSFPPLLSFTVRKPMVEGAMTA